MVYNFSWGAFQHVSFLPTFTYQQFQKFSLMLVLSSLCPLCSWTLASLMPQNHPLSLSDSGPFTAWLSFGAPPASYLVPTPLQLLMPEPACRRPKTVDMLQLSLLPNVVPGLLFWSACWTLLTCLLALWFVLCGFCFLSFHSSLAFPPDFVHATLSSVHSVTMAYFYFSMVLIIFLVLLMFILFGKCIQKIFSFGHLVLFHWEVLCIF